MDIQILIAQLDRSQEFFNRSTSALTEADAAFAPTPDGFTTAQSVAHVAKTIDWFVEGAFSSNGFNMDTEEHINALDGIETLAQARELLSGAYDRARATLRSKSTEELEQPLPAGPVMGGAPRYWIVGGIEEHTAHHRGALSVHARLRGHVPPMPYMDM